jgi:hypothetical protein
MIQHIHSPGERGHVDPLDEAAASAPTQDASKPVVPFESMLERVCVIGENMRVLLLLRAERRRLRVRTWIVHTITGALVALALVPLVIAAVMRLVTGMAQGFTLMWDGRSWLGDVTTGVVILACVGLLAFAATRSLSRTNHERREARLGHASE